MNKQKVKVSYLRMAPRKVRSVADLVRGLTVNEAEAQLMVIRRRAAKPILKLLRSAIAAVKNNKKGEPEKFYIETIHVDQGPMLKRFLPRARGSASPIQKKSSHVTLVLAEKEGSTARFKIVVPKKTKLPPELNKTEKKEKEQQKEEKTSSAPRKPGFFKRVFSRKAGFSK